MRLWLALVIALAASVAANVWVQDTRARYRLSEPRSMERKKGWTPGTVQSLVNGTFWEIRRSLAILSWNEAQTYFHNGFDVTVLTANREELEKTPEEADTDRDHAYDHDHTHGVAAGGHSDEEERRVRSLRNHPFLKRSPLRPYVYEHKEGGAIAEASMMPFYWLTTQFDPNFVRAYTNGAYFLAFRLKDPDGRTKIAEAMRYLERGIRFNPDEPSLYGVRGRVYFSKLGDYAKAEDDFTSAVELYSRRLAQARNLKADDQEIVESVLPTMRYLGRTYIKRGKYDEAIAVAKRGLALNPEATGLKSIIEDATAARRQPGGGK